MVARAVQRLSRLCRVQITLFSELGQIRACDLPRPWRRCDPCLPAGTRFERMMPAYECETDSAHCPLQVKNAFAAPSDFPIRVRSRRHTQGTKNPFSEIPSLEVTSPLPAANRWFLNTEANDCCWRNLLKVRSPLEASTIFALSAELPSVVHPFPAERATE